MPTPLESAPKYNPIFERLVSESGGPNALPGLIAYGLYKTAKREWVSDLSAREGRKPTDAELDAYMRTWTASQITTIQERAEQFLAEYASAVIQEEEPRILREAVRGSFWRAILPSVVASFLYTLVLIAIALILARSGIDLLGIFRDVAGS